MAEQKARIVLPALTVTEAADLAAILSGWVDETFKTYEDACTLPLFLSLEDMLSTTGAIRRQAEVAIKIRDYLQIQTQAVTLEEDLR